MAATYVVGSSYIRLLSSPLSDLGAPSCNIYLLSNHVMKTQTYCSCIILMIVRYIQCINNIEGNILDISLSLSTTKKIRRKDCPAGRCAWLASLCPSIFFPPFSHRHKSRMKKEILINGPPQRQARKET